MSLLFSLLMKADAGQAKAELRSLSSEVAKGKTEIAGIGNAAAVADGKVDALGNASARAAAQNDKLAQSQTRVHATSGMAAGSVGNLVSQFNDIAMMTAAGQSPLQLAIQQGTSITQVIGPMGAAGAVRALGGAFMSMLNPLNLLMLGGIAVGSAIVQSFMGAGDAVESLTDRLEDSAAAIDELKKIAGTATEDLREDFGAITTDVVAMQGALGKLASVKAFDAMRASVSSLKAETEGSWFAAFTEKRFTQGGEIAELLNTDWLVRGKLVATDQVANFRTSLEELGTARGPHAQLEVFRSLQDQLLAATGGIDHMTLSQMAFYEGLVRSEVQIRENVQAQKEAVFAAQEMARAAKQEDGRMGAPLAVDLRSEDTSAGNVSADLGNAQELLSTLRDQASVQSLISQYGDDSQRATLARLEAERAVQAEMVASLDVSDDLKLELMAAWDAANGIASARIAAMLEQALGPASRLTGLLKTAAGYWTTMKWQMSLARADATAGPGFERGGRMGDAAGPVAPDIPTFDELYDRDTRNLRTGSGAGAARAERDAVAELIEKLREEQEVLAETDPVKREMLKYRQQLAEASAAQRAEVEGLIRAEMQLKAIQAAREYATDVVGDFLDQIIVKGAKASDVLKNLAAQFLSMAARSLLSGSGWFADLLGISGPLFGGGKAATSVPGSGKLTASYEPVAARLNLSSGKSVSSLPAAPARVPPVFHINVNGATGNEEVRKMTAEGVRAGLKHYDTYVLPGRVDEIKRKPRDR